jgi:hypothetical protein
MRRGKLAAALFTDSNSSDDDAQFDGTPVVKGASGRKLAGLPWNLPQVAARLLHRAGKAPGLPHWSWLFDYAQPLLFDERTVVGAYHAADSGHVDMTAGVNGNRFDGGKPRSSADPRLAAIDAFKWPRQQDQIVPIDYHLRIDKFARQGAFDNAHIAADHGRVEGSAGANATITSAPFCAEMCTHVHWRWGAVGVTVASEPYAFLGWGSGKNGYGAHRVLGAPLIPPNQHLDITVSPAVDATGATFTYAVGARRPNEKKWQVFFEQGIGFAFSYRGTLKRGDIKNLALAFLSLDALPLLVKEILFKPGDFTPDLTQSVDYALRQLFHAIYEQIKFFTAGDNVSIAPDPILQTPARLDGHGFLTPPLDAENL